MALAVLIFSDGFEKGIRALLHNTEPGYLFDFITFMTYFLQYLSTILKLNNSLISLIDVSAHKCCL